MIKKDRITLILQLSKDVKPPPVEGDGNDQILEPKTSWKQIPEIITIQVHQGTMKTSKLSSVAASSVL